MSWQPIPQEDIEHIRDNGVDLNLLLTRRCNFQCEHCMYSAGPKLPAAYMSWDDLNAIYSFTQYLQDTYEIGCTINLVGGEPTLDLDEFERVLDTVTEWQLPLEMTTNGWWLRSHQTLTKFLRIVLPAVRDHEMTIRISDSVWHDAFRTPHELRLLEVGLEDLFSNPFDHLYQYEPSKCPECGQTETEENEVGDRVCVGCGCSEDDFYPDMPGMSIIEEAHQYLERIHVDRQGNNPEKLSPVGRARRSYFAAGQDGACGATADVKFTFEPGAKLYDPCCNGGHVKLGSARDPEQLFRARYWFMRALHAKFPSPQSYKHNALGGERCRQCPVFGAQWLVKNTKSHIHNELQSLVGS